jgi:murein DD-endopeptidase MepM/ murein hydrolase activator NlpD
MIATWSARFAILSSIVGLMLAFAGDAPAQGKKGREAKSGEATAPPAGADLDPETIGAFFPQRAEIEAMRRRGFVATGLRPVYPADAKCPEANSFFADMTRGDGSARSSRFYVGYHGGLDIPAPEGTPILAVADGTVVHAGEGGSIGGIGIVLLHAPEDTGFAVWVYTEYKHLRELPNLELGRRVKMGEVIAYSGKTGTAGGRAYGPAGHPHLHLTAWYAPGDQYRSGRMLIPLGGQWMDPLALFRGPPLASAAVAALTDAAKKTPLPHKRTDGRIVPERTRVIWPFACATN